jgi:hypothetical protein
MGDYLTGLAARAIGLATVVRPRPAVRFESPPFEEQEPGSPTTSPVPQRGPAPARRRKTAQGRAAPAEPPTSRAVPSPRVSSAPPSPVEGEPESSAAHDHETPPALDAPLSRPAARPAERARSTTVPALSPERAAVVVQPAARRAAELSVPQPRPARREPPPVRVSIGRIEVRAVTPPAAPPRPAPQRPTPLSLDEYLELRRSGRR